MNELKKLLQIFELEPIERNIFRGASHDLGLPNLFGGQVLGQALVAAARTVEAERPAHSCHAYFLRPGDAKSPVVYQVDCLRDGGSFTTRHVTAVQHGRPIFELSASFQLPERGFEHQDSLPEGVPPPEGLKTQQELYADRHGRLPEPLAVARPVEIRPVLPGDEEKQHARQRSWFRAVAKLPDDARLHQALLAYASDFELLATAMLPHGLSWINGNVFGASLDHALWLHRPFRIDDWLLYDIHSPNAGNGRGLSWGKIFSRDGKLVATVAQEGLMRKRKA